MQLTSPVFQNGQPIPIQFTSERFDLSPPLEWSEIPKHTQEFALLVEDPDAPVSPFKDNPYTHWVAYHIPANVTALPPGLPQEKVVELPISLNQGKNSFGKIGYDGPLPPEGHGLHHYIFTLYALDQELKLDAGASKHDLLKAIEGHVLAASQLIGTYERPAGLIH